MSSFFYKRLPSLFLSIRFPHPSLPACRSCARCCVFQSTGESVVDQHQGLSLSVLCPLCADPPALLSHPSCPFIESICGLCRSPQVLLDSEVTMVKLDLSRCFSLHLILGCVLLYFTGAPLGDQEHLPVLRFARSIPTNACQRMSVSAVQLHKCNHGAHTVELTL